MPQHTACTLRLLGWLAVVTLFGSGCTYIGPASRAGYQGLSCSEAGPPGSSLGHNAAALLVDCVNRGK